MDFAINNNIYIQAQHYANSRGLNLSTMIENFLKRFIDNAESEATSEPLPDIVLGLMGAGEQVADDDLNAREAYYSQPKHRVLPS